MPTHSTATTHSALRTVLLAGLALAALTGLARPAAAQEPVHPLCSSDGQLPPRVLLERFISADCAACWTASDTPRAAPGELVLDWVLPGESGDDAPLSAVARRDALLRAENLALRLPDKRETLSKKMQITSPPIPGQARPARLRVAQGLVLGGHIGTSLRFTAPRGATGPFTGWLALVELLPAGTEGSPVPRALVRNLITEPITAQPGGDLGQIWRPMNVPEGANPQRLAVLGWVSNARGQVVIAAQSVCTPGQGE